MGTKYDTPTAEGEESYRLRVQCFQNEKQTFGAWGVNRGGGFDESFFNMMEIGDIVAIYFHQQIEFLGEVIAKEEKSNPARK